MKLVQTVLEKNFIVKYWGKTYSVNYLNSDGYALGLFNRFNWEIYDEDHNELKISEYGNTTKTQKEQIQKNLILMNKLIDFCIKHFDDYRAELD